MENFGSFHNWSDDWNFMGKAKSLSRINFYSSLFLISLPCSILALAVMVVKFDRDLFHINFMDNINFLSRNGT